MTMSKGIPLAGFICFVSILASANSVSSIPIEGDATKGFVQTTGDFNILGPGLSLFQGLPDGPNSIGTCTAGTLCDFSFGISNSTAFCQYCTGSRHVRPS